MFKNKFIAITVSVFVIVTLAACGVTTAPTQVNQPTQAQAVPLNTQVAEALASTLAVQTAVANAVASTQTAMATAVPITISTATPQSTFTPSLTLPAAPTSTPTFPTVSVSTATNCRSGPTTDYNILGVLNVGQNAEVVGRSIYSDTLVIQLPSNPSITCWLWTQNARVAGNTSGLPFVNVPSTPTPWPTPVAAFTVVYNSTITCNGIYELKFEIENTGSVTWESDKIKATNLGTNEVVTESRNDFPNVVNGCTEPSDDQNLESGEVGYTMSGNFSANPAGHNFSAVIHVCSEDNMNGTCMQTTITFTP